MKPLHPSTPVTRRAFLAAGAFGAGLLAADRSAEANPRPGSPAPHAGSQFDYDVGRLREVDPALITYDPLRTVRLTRAPARRVAIAPDGRIYIAAGNSILLLDPDGSLRGELRQPVPARAVAVLDDRLYVGLKDHVRVLDRDGRFVSDWDPIPGRCFLTGLAVTPNDLFAADSGNRVVLRYDRSGKPMRRLGEKDPRRDIPGLVVPSPCLDVESGPGGLVWINNPGRHRVEAYTPDGEPEFAWGKASAAIDGFCGCCNPTGIALLPDGRCVTFEKGLPRVKVFTREGRLDCVVAGPASFTDATVRQEPLDPDDLPGGTLDGAVTADGRVHVIDRPGGALRVFVPRSALRAG